jgi:rhodanese-related sulfurtransferase/rubrerythrin
MNIHKLSPTELRQFIQSRHEKAYILIDVRQPEEYEQGHIPGARLIPLPELVKTINTLPCDRQLVFYCRSGARSMAAATMVAEEGIGLGNIINLNGGILAWDGGVISDYPDVKLFNGQAAPAKLLETAMNLEKGALNFYAHVRTKYADRSWVNEFDTLAKEELDHARIVYHFWRQIEIKGEPFDPLFDRLSGEVLEGGMRLSTAMEKISAIKTPFCIGLIEMALNIEYAAFDLYHTMAERVPVSDAKEAFITIAQAEKAHMHSLAKAIDTCS